MGISKKRPLLLEALEDRRLLSGFSLLSLTPILAEASVETEVLGVELAASVEASVAVGSDSLVQADLSLGAALNGPIDAAVRTEIVIDDGIRADLGAETAIGPVEIDLGGSARVDDPTATLPESPLPELPLPESPLPESPLPELPELFDPPLASPSHAPPADFLPIADAARTDAGQDAAALGAALIDGRLWLSEEIILVSDVERLESDGETTEEGALLDDGDPLADGWRLTEEEQHAILEMLDGFLLANQTGHFGPGEIPEQLGLRQSHDGLIADDSLLQDEENFVFMGGAVDDFFRSLLGAFDAFKGWLARIGPIPWVVLGLAFAAAALEAAQRRQAARRQVARRRDELAGV